MRSETWVAIYAAIVGTGALLLNFKSWLDSGVTLRLNIIPDGMVFGGDKEFDESDLIIINVVNRGDTATTITNLTVHEMPTLWSRWRRRAKHSFVVTNSQLKGYPPNVPMELEPNKRWTGAIRQRPDIVPDLRTGTFYAAVHGTHRDRAYYILIPKKREQPGAPKLSP